MRIKKADGTIIKFSNVFEVNEYIYSNGLYVEDFGTLKHKVSDEVFGELILG